MAVKEFMTLYIYKEIFVDGCYDLSLASGPAPFIIDVGANTGLFIIRMKQLYPNSRVAGYEPLPSNFLQLKRSIELSRLDHVDIFMQGVGVLRESRSYIFIQRTLEVTASFRVAQKVVSMWK